MDDEILILFVQEYKELYDHSCNNHMNNVRRLNAWEEISGKMNCSAEECRKRWTQLRENYRKSIAKAKKTTTGQAGGKRKTIKFEKELLNDYMSDQRQRVTNVGLSEETVLSEIDIDSAPTITSSPETVQASSGRSTPSPAPPKYGRKPQTNMMAEYFRFKKELQEKRICSKLTELPNADHLTYFFRSMEKTVRNLPTNLQVEAKSKISTIVHELEFKALEMPCPESGRHQGQYSNTQYSPSYSYNDPQYPTFRPEYSGSGHINPMDITQQQCVSPQPCLPAEQDNENNPPTDMGDAGPSYR